MNLLLIHSPLLYPPSPALSPQLLVPDFPKLLCIYLVIEVDPLGILSLYLQRATEVASKLVRVTPFLTL